MVSRGAGKPLAPNTGISCRHQRHQKPAALAAAAHARLDNLIASSPAVMQHHAEGALQPAFSASLQPLLRLVSEDCIGGGADRALRILEDREVYFQRFGSCCAIRCYR